ncbi:MAG: hypothetical protein JW864_12235 [Spirochaetes bacterium]|nr:hypothetical protein [Spirochaetota bacterium]
MPKEYKHALLISTVLTIVAGIGVFTGVYFKWALIIAIAMIPAVVYEIYRTEGFFSKIVSFLCLFIILAEIFAIITHSMVDLSRITGNHFQSVSFLHEKTQAAFIGTVLLIILCLLLFKRTRGFYTQWLSVLILLSSIGLFFASNPDFSSSIANSENAREIIKKEIKNNIPD